MSLKIEELLQKITLPKRFFNNNFAIQKKFRDEAKTFISLLEQCDGNEFDVDYAAAINRRKSDILDVAQKNIESLLKAIEHYENSDQKAAQEAFDDLMAQIKNDIFIFCFINSHFGTFCDRIC